MYRDGLRQGDAEIAHPVAVNLKNGDIDDDLRTGAIEIVEELLREQELVRSGPDNDGVLTGDEVDLGAGIEDVAEGLSDFVLVGLLAGVSEVEGLDGGRIEVGVLGAGVLRDEDGIRGDRFIEGA